MYELTIESVREPLKGYLEAFKFITQFENTNPKETMTTLLPRRLEFSNLN